MYISVLNWMMTQKDIGNLRKQCSHYPKSSATSESVLRKPEENKREGRESKKNKYESHGRPSK